MSGAVRAPKSLSLMGCISDNWRKFRQNFEIFMVASGKDKESEEIKVAIFLNIIGEEAVELFNTFQLLPADKKELVKVLGAFEGYCNPKKNIVYERYMFNKRVQNPGEKFEEFLTDVKKLAQSCEFQYLQDQLIRDKLVMGITDLSLQERLLRMGSEELTLQKTIEYCRSAEASKQQMSNLHQSTSEVHRLRVVPQNHNRSTQGNNEEKTENFKCRRCNTIHGPRQCPAYGKKCAKCSKLNHFMACCRVQPRQQSVQSNVHPVELDSNQSRSFSGRWVEEEEKAQEELFLAPVQILNSMDTTKRTQGWYQDIWIGNQLIRVKLDCGAEVSTLPEHLFNKYFKTKMMLKPTEVVLKCYGNFKIHPVGCLILNIKYKHFECIEKFFVIKGNEIPLLSYTACENLNLIKRLDVVNSSLTSSVKDFVNINADLFDGLGCFTSSCKIDIIPGSNPVINPPRRIPVKLMEKLKPALDNLVLRKIIEKVENPQGWVSNLVIVEKNDGKLRICLDPRNLNKVIKRPPDVLIPTLTDITEKLSNKKVFTVLDLKEGFWHVRLDQESSDLCTFSTPYGCYKFLRLPFGISMAPEYFQRENFKNFGDISGVIIYIDDLLIAAENEEQHDKILGLVLQRARQLGVKFNKSKIQLKQDSVRYLGHIFSKTGMQIDPDRVRAIDAIEEPTNMKKIAKHFGHV